VKRGVRRGGDFLPLALLTASAHPDEATRGRVAELVDAFLLRRRPLQAEGEVRGFLAARAGRDLDPAYREPPLLDLAVRVVRLVFARGTPEHWKCTLHLGRCSDDGDAPDLVLGPQLAPVSPDNFPRRLVVTVGGDVLVPWLRSVQVPEGVVEVRCSVSEGVVFRVRGTLPWPAYAADVRVALAHPAGLHSLPGVRVERRGRGLRLAAVIPEDVIRLSAALARGGRLVLRSERYPHRGRVVVGLRPLEGEWGELPAAVACPLPAAWLGNHACLRVKLTTTPLPELAACLPPAEGWPTYDLPENLT
jgi:hypothetical protein